MKNTTHHRAIGVLLMSIMMAAFVFSPALGGTTAAAADSTTRIVFRSDRDGTVPDGMWNLYTAEFDGTSVTNVQHFDIGQRPKISPDGNKIVYEQRIDGYWQIFTANFDGSDKKQITPNGKHHSWTAWSPDGTQIAYEVDREVWIMNTDGSNPRQVTTTSGPNNRASFSPDGTQLVYQSQQTGKWEIYTINVDGSNPRQITFDSAEARHPSWHPNGNLLLFDMKAAGASRFDVYVYDLTTDRLTNLTNLPDTHDHFPVWSPDGNQIMFTSLRDPNYKESLWVMDADGTNARMIMGDPAAKNEWPSWGR